MHEFIQERSLTFVISAEKDLVKVVISLHKNDFIQKRSLKFVKAVEKDLIKVPFSPDINKFILELNLVCDVCVLGFSQTEDRIKNKRIHTGGKPYICD